MSDFLYIHAELVLLFTLLGLVLNEVSYHGEKTRLTYLTTWIGLGSALIQTILSYRIGSNSVFSGAFILDGLSQVFKILFLLLGLLLTAQNQLLNGAERRTPKSEPLIYVVGLVLAMSVAVSSAHLILMFASLQLAAVCGFFLLRSTRKPELAAEAGLKLLSLFLIADLFFLLASFFLYQQAHTLNIIEIHRFLTQTAADPRAAWVILILFLSSFGFFTAGFPMHSWLLDVAEGSTARQSLAVLLGFPLLGYAVILRLFGIGLSLPTGAALVAPFGVTRWTWIVAAVSGFTMIFGSVLSLHQKQIKRLLGCIYLTQLGTLNLTLLALNRETVAALIHNLLVDLFSLFGAFLALNILIRACQADTLDVMRQEMKTKGKTTFLAVCVLIGLTACIAGIVPLPGVFGTFALLGAIAEQGWYGLAGLGALSHVLCLFSFAQLAYALLSGLQGSSQRRAAVGDGSEDFFLRRVLTLSFVPPTLLMVFSGPIMHWVARSLRNILW